MSQATQTFDILSRIAVGNGALVYRALDKETARHVAVKLLIQDGNWEHLLDADSLMQAAPRLRQISGTHVCRLLDAYQDEAGPILVYEFADGKNGVDLATERKPDPAQALDMAAQFDQRPAFGRAAAMPARGSETVEYRACRSARWQAVPPRARLGPGCLPEGGARGFTPVSCARAAHG